MNTSVKHLRRFFIKNKKKFSRTSQRVSTGPTKKDVHSLRKIIRRLRVVMKLMGLRSEHKKFKKLAHTLGYLRDLDVAKINANIFDLDQKEINLKRIKHKKKVVDYLNKERIRKLRKILSNVQDLLLDMAERNLSTPLKKLSTEVQGWKNHKISSKNLHELRIIFKKIRYTLEALGRPAEELKVLQDTLGQAHDLDVLGNLAEITPKVSRAKQKLTNKGISLAKSGITQSIKALETISSGPH